MRNRQHRVIQRRQLTEQAFVLRFERRDLEFLPGQYLNVGLCHDGQQREYSIYSGLQDDFLEILVRSIPEGHVSCQLARLNPGDPVLVEGPHGRFTLNPTGKDRHTFIATGTGISPFHCFSRSYPSLDYCILHGIRYGQERYDHQEYPNQRYFACTSRSQEGDFVGRVTDYLQEGGLDTTGQFHLCGNSDMIYEVFFWLDQQGIERERISTEVYF